VTLALGVSVGLPVKALPPVRDYMAELRQPDDLKSLAGFTMAKVFQDGAAPASSLDVPILQLNQSLRNCVMGGGGSGGYPGILAHSVDYRYFDCLQADAPSRTLLVLLPFDRSGQLIGVYVQAGGRFHRPSPAPQADLGRAAN
jgi:hypothetical protein